jgi:cephalosporin hydroxylase
VGVWQGKSLVLLSLLKVQGETVFGFDLFTGELKAATENNLAQYGDPSNVQLHEVDANQFGFDQLRSLINKPLRFLHIDAGHEYHEVLHQLKLYTPFLGDDAVIAMDDTEDREFPGVSAAVWYGPSSLDTF